MARLPLATIADPIADVRGIDTLANAATGRLLVRVPPAAVLVPDNVTIDGEQLVFGGTYPETQKVPADLLERFVTLQTDHAIVSFARRFGPLCLFDSPDGLHPNPRLLTWESPYEQAYREVREPSQPISAHKEPLKGWRRFRWEFNGLLILAAFIHDKADLDQEMLDRLAKHGIDVPRRTLGELLGLSAVPRDRWLELPKHEQKKHAAELLVGRVGTFVQWCGLHPTLSIQRESRVDFRFVDSNRFGLSLFGALTLQLLAAATGSGFAVCSGCGAPFVPLRREPAHGKRRYCRACGRKVAVRHAMGEWRARERAKRAKRARRRI